MTWNLFTLLEAKKKEEEEAKKPGPAHGVYREFERLNHQVCPYCSGYGHAGKDCPTDSKLTHLRGGVREQNVILQALRAECRREANMKAVESFSLLSPIKGTNVAKTRGSQLVDLRSD